MGEKVNFITYNSPAFLECATRDVVTCGLFQPRRVNKKHIRESNKTDGERRRVQKYNSK
jgi:hypothetical protein